MAFCLPCINEVFLKCGLSQASKPPSFTENYSCIFCKQFQSRVTHTIYGTMKHRSSSSSVVYWAVSRITLSDNVDGSPHEIPGIPVRAPGSWWEDGGLSLLQSALQALALLTQPPPHLRGVGVRQDVKSRGPQHLSHGLVPVCSL